MGKIIAIASQKGGVGKTTTAINLSACLAVKGRKILVIDSDPQASLTFGLGIRKNGEKIKGLYELYAGKATLQEVLSQSIENLYVIPSRIDLFMAELEIFETEQREKRLKFLLESFKDEFDYIFIDCPPSFSFLTLCALVASESVIIPVQCEQFALEALRIFIKLLWRIKGSFNEALELEGILLTMFSKHINLSRTIAEDIKRVFRSKIFETYIPRNIALSEASMNGIPAIFYAPDAYGTIAYSELAQEIISRHSPS
ncbi:MULTISPECIES: ParA family protein [Thermodesulfovibrio]|uniref:ParA family protein n=1 Tax=Thermodesulfovibrio yellowstonii TaxID=28262 RepID=UPI0003F8A744|nr:ParA family protein [Thermodesulfovibrio islandicus]